MSEVFESEVSTAIQAVVAASVICRSVQKTIADDAMEKKDRSPVTVADFASQAVICRALREMFPNDPIVGEEDSKELRTAENAPFRTRILKEIQATGVEASEEEVLSWIDFGNHDGSADRFWTLDPIDGTKGFLRKEQFAISLALIVDGTIQVAALACPNLQTRDTWDNAQGVVLSAVRGQGARMTPLDLLDVTPHTTQVSAIKSPLEARLCESVESGHTAHGWSGNVREQLGTKAEAVRIDSQAKYAVVARGDAEVYLRLPTRKDYQEKIWDHAGGVLVVEESGGTVTDIDGRPLDFSQGSTLKNNRGVVVTNGLLHDDVLKAIAAAEE
ncbi:3'(2'),5'-bisphosphate nucleotidase [Thalassoglobus sp.]|uniref:3'(2'),5'-bisphosphate nucleotidase n=1 Tax=Thalassoglobus sp. TaxID=2795869 RepID=UPI003AA89179